MNDIAFDFTGKTAVIIGGSKGIGWRVAKQFVEAGAEVISLARHHFSLDFNMVQFECDVTSADDVREAFKHLDKYDSIDFLINVVGTNQCIPIEEIALDDWEEVLDVNLKSVFLFSKYTARRMKEQRSGSIVNVSSIAGRSKSVVSGVHYTASKAGMIGFTRQLAQELGPYNVRVNVVCPSQTRTGMLQKAMSDEQLLSLEERIPIRRIAEPEEVAKPILFLCSSAASYITGAALDINGGQL